MGVLQSHRTGAIATIAVLALSLPTLAAERPASAPDFSGQWGRDMTFFELPAKGPGPVVSTDRKPDGTANVLGAWAGDHTNPILKPEAADAVRKRAELARKGTVAPDMHNSCWAEPPPYVMSLPFGVQIVQRKDEIVFIYLINNALRRVPLDVRRSEKLEPSLQGHSVGRFEGDTLIIDTVGIKVTPLSTVDPFGTPFSAALHVVERYRLIEGEAASRAQEAHGIIARPFLPYGRGAIDPDTTKKGLEVEFTVEDEGVFTTPWSARVTYRPVIKPWPAEWPEVVCAENPHFGGSDQHIPTANTPDF
jgi:hypothetical protein